MVRSFIISFKWSVVQEPNPVWESATVPHSATFTTHSSSPFPCIQFWSQVLLYNAQNEHNHSVIICQCVDLCLLIAPRPGTHTHANTDMIWQYAIITLKRRNNYVSIVCYVCWVSANRSVNWFITGFCICRIEWPHKDCESFCRTSQSQKRTWTRCVDPFTGRVYGKQHPYLQIYVK